MTNYLGSIEAGGTKFVCAIGTEDLKVIHRESFPTTTPAETMSKVIAFFKKYSENLLGIGIGAFGPIDVHHQSPTYGFITSTPKISWQHYDLLGAIKQFFSIPIALTTDVNAAAYGEYVAGNGRDTSSLAYYTIGTGVGGGAIQKGQFIEGFSHPEMGHMLIRKHPEDPFEGNCPFHGTCLEGVAAGPAIEKRLGISGQNLDSSNSYWDIEAYYLAQCAYNTTLLLRPDVIILGGGVMKNTQLLSKIRKEFAQLLNNYVTTPDLVNYIVTPYLEDNAATIGCFALAKKAII